MTAVVLCSHLPGEGHFRSERFSVDPVCCHDALDYWRGFEKHWDSDLTIVNVEHDMEATDEHVQALLDCPEIACSWAYRANWISSGFPGGVIAAGLGARDAEHNPDPGYLQGGEEWANWSAIGLVKITTVARLEPLRAEPWQTLELAVHDAVTTPWHMHGNAVGGADLVPHHHW